MTFYPMLDHPAYWSFWLRRRTERLRQHALGMEKALAEVRDEVLREIDGLKDQIAALAAAVDVERCDKLPDVTHKVRFCKKAK